MNHLKSFLLGVGVSFSVYYLTKRRPGGRSILDDILENPHAFLDSAKDQVIADVVDTVKEKIS
ncbi:MAG: YtxH domain-containing protein [Chitinophagaceae bacterium]|nr:MAG: YtxH domain-containing protein [Chitinophagaceae bacterium]